MPVPLLVLFQLQLVYALYLPCLPCLVTVQNRQAGGSSLETFSLPSAIHSHAHMPGTLHTQHLSEEKNEYLASHAKGVGGKP